MSDTYQIRITELPAAATRDEALSALIAAMEDVLDERQIRHLTNAVQIREETQSTYLDNGLAVPHGRTTALESIYLSVGLCPSGIDWPDGATTAKLIIMIGVPTIMVTAYLTTLQKLLRWHKNAPLGPNGEWTGTPEELMTSLQHAMK